MEPLFHEDADGGGDECDEETQYPKGVDNGIDSRFLKGWRSEIRESRIDEVSVDGKVGYLDGELHENMVGEIFGLLL